MKDRHQIIKEANLLHARLREAGMFTWYNPRTEREEVYRKIPSDTLPPECWFTETVGYIELTEDDEWKFILKENK